MVNDVAFFVNGEPVAKARARKGRSGWYTPKKTADYENRLAGTALQEMHGHPPIKGPLSVTISVYRSYPKSMSKKKRVGAVPATKPDLDNYVKIVLDAMNTIVYADDNQIIQLRASKHYHDKPGVSIIVEEMI